MSKDHSTRVRGTEDLRVAGPRGGRARLPLVVVAALVVLALLAPAAAWASSSPSPAAWPTGSSRSRSTMNWPWMMSAGFAIASRTDRARIAMFLDSGALNNQWLNSRK